MSIRVCDDSVGAVGVAGVDANARVLQCSAVFFAHHSTPSLFFHTFIFADLFNRVEILIWDMKTKAVFHGKSTYQVRDFLDEIFSQYSLLIITYTQSDLINNENVCILMV